MKIKIWEIALLVAIVISVFAGSLAFRQAELSENLIRLHVVANSNSEEDQTLKLQVRDGVLKRLGGLLEGCTNKKDAERIIANNRDALIEAANDTMKERGKAYPVSATIMTENFPTVKYDTFTLPAGSYTSLRIIIGEGAGKNWWCVVFPPLCLSAAEKTTSFKDKGISDETLKIITEGSEEYVVKFKILEILSKLGTTMAEANNSADVFA